ncbi:MAG: hypothetical protein ACFFDF_13820 [Candidatus Odinarchaeota archaeon]
MKISLMRKINIFVIGVIGTLVILLMIETLTAQFLTDFLIGHISDNVMVLILILGLFLLTIIISYIVGFFMTGDIQQISVLKASILSFACTILFLFIISNGTLFIYYPQVFSKIHGFEIALVFPQVLVYFAIYILNIVFNLFILTIVVYYLWFIFFLEKLYKMRYKIE